MASHRDVEPSTAPSAVDLVGYFRAAAKPREQWLIGIEQEKIGVLTDGRPVPYDGSPSISQILEGLVARGFDAKTEDGHIIALERGAERITIEPGGQLELSGAALLLFRVPDFGK